MILDEFNNDFIILCGDWNLAQNFNLDCYNYVSHNYPKSREELNKLKTKYNLIDPWRVLNPDKQQYTWHRTNPIKQGRLDFFVISSELMNFVENASILPGYRTDHSYIEIELKINDFEWFFFKVT